MKDVEPLLERGQREKVKVDERRLQQLVRGFAADWKKSIETLNQDIMQSFTNFKNGTAILQVIRKKSPYSEEVWINDIHVAQPLLNKLLAQF